VADVVNARGTVRAAPDPAAVEAALAVVPGVSRVTLVPDVEGGPGVLRLVLDSSSDEVVVARSVHRILRMQFGVGLDPGRLEIVEEPAEEPLPVAPTLHVVEETVDDGLELGEQIEALLAGIDSPVLGPRFHPDVLDSAVRHPAGTGAEPDGVDPAAGRTGAARGGSSAGRAPSAARAGAPDRPADPERLAISRLSLSADGLGMRATVTLSRGAMSCVGNADGPASPASVHRVVASATLNALQDVLGSGHRVDVEAVAITPLGDGQVAVVQVVWATVDGTERLTGASEVRDDTRQAVIRATLDAVNRRLAPHLDI
jgi:hypothetical protein